MRGFFRVVAGLLLVCPAVTNCSSSATNEQKNTCSAGEAVSCVHGSGCAALKVCTPDGNFGACECVDAGSAGAGAGGIPGTGGTGGSGGATGGTGGSAAISGSGGGSDDAGCDASAEEACESKCGKVNDACGQDVECGGCSAPNFACLSSTCVCDCPNIVAAAPNCELSGCACTGHNSNTDESNCGCSGVVCPAAWTCEAGVCTP